MKPYKCVACGNDTVAPDDYEPEYCCNGVGCGCYGKPINPIFCDECEALMFMPLLGDTTAATEMEGEGFE